MTDIPEDIHDIADDIWILMAANTCGRTELTEIIARAILAERVHAESKLAEARAEALESQINEDRHFFLKAKAAQERIDKLEKALEPFVALIERSDSMDLEYLAEHAPGIDLEVYMPSTAKFVSSGEMRIVERLQSHMGKADMGEVLADCRIAADEIERLRKALEQSRSVLAMMIDPNTIMETNVLNAYALAVAAEASARAALEDKRGEQNDGST